VLLVPTEGLKTNRQLILKISVTILVVFIVVIIVGNVIIVKELIRVVLLGLGGDAGSAATGRFPFVVLFVKEK